MAESLLTGLVFTFHLFVDSNFVSDICKLKPKETFKTYLKNFLLKKLKFFFWYTYPESELKIFLLVAGEPDESVGSVGLERELDALARIDVTVGVRQSAEVVHDPILTVERQVSQSTSVSPLI